MIFIVTDKCVDSYGWSIPDSLFLGDLRRVRTAILGRWRERFLETVMAHPASLQYVGPQVTKMRRACVKCGVGLVWIPRPTTQRDGRVDTDWRSTCSCGFTYQHSETSYPK